MLTLEIMKIFRFVTRDILSEIFLNNINNKNFFETKKKDKLIYFFLKIFSIKQKYLKFTW